MKKVIALAALAVIAMSPVAQAEDAMMKKETTMSSETTMSAEAKEATLKDGTKVSIEGEKVFVVAADGTKTPAPDAEHEMADGTKVKTMHGMIVK